MAAEHSFNSVELAAELTIAWLGNQNNRVVADEVPAFLRTIHMTVQELANESLPASDAAQAAGARAVPAVSVRKSLESRDYLISLIDGKPYKTLKRHLARHGLTPEEYRERYSLKPDYPMVAPSYSEARRTVAKQLGLGQKGRAAKARAALEKQARSAAPRRGAPGRTQAG